MKKECLCKIRSIYRIIGAFEQSLQKQFNLNINEAMLLCVVNDKNNISCGEIAEEMGLTNSNTSKVISSLEKKKLICRHYCKEDLRCMKFSISDKGKDLLSTITCDNVQLPAEIRCLAE